MLRRVAEGQRSSPGEVVITKAFLIETQSVFSDNSSPIAGMIVQVQIDPNKLGIKLAGVEASSLKDCNEPWTVEEHELGGERLFFTLEGNPVPISSTGVPMDGCRDAGVPMDGCRDAGVRQTMM
ncbi:unnamed protein product [Peronospora belbahrii]|uniref:Uncharacterized protein n=1 Tax=Peronospora belbahrii TaxID=622444 RepID=A0ABN8D362_9STRA|nr:unnamed protein product [Peronospora belbahrii]